jgi:hypothetical protein
MAEVMKFEDMSVWQHSLAEQNREMPCGWITGTLEVSVVGS